MLKEFLEMSMLDRIEFIEQRLGISYDSVSVSSKILSYLILTISPLPNDAMTPREYLAEALKLIQKHQKPLSHGLGDLIEEIEESLR